MLKLKIGNLYLINSPCSAEPIIATYIGKAFPFTLLSYENFNMYRFMGECGPEMINEKDIVREAAKIYSIVHEKQRESR